MAPLRLALHAVTAVPTLIAYALLVAPTARVRSWRNRGRRAKPAVLWGPTPIANIRNSVLADRLYGYPSDSLVYRVYTLRIEHLSTTSGNRFACRTSAS